MKSPKIYCYSGTCKWNEGQQCTKEEINLIHLKVDIKKISYSDYTCDIVTVCTEFEMEEGKGIAWDVKKPLHGKLRGKMKGEGKDRRIRWE